ncbi:hypothetical protein [Pantanalinema sp. GBBB05]|uniref:hypothetical protein n=1 Tax=Pantanalinema sp. GBBB05 TaxID=2604139 RepID=UPI001DA260F7|nr:hypothetical protein [Pantanalinema sp. GBBB05]
MSTFMIGIGTVLLWGLWLGSLVGVVSLIVAMMRDRRSAKRQKMIACPASRPIGIRIPPPMQSDTNYGLHEQLHNRILMLLNHDQLIANQLIRNVQVANPDQSKQWVLEQVIADLERDRR